MDSKSCFTEIGLLLLLYYYKYVKRIEISLKNFLKLFQKCLTHTITS